MISFSSSPSIFVAALLTINLNASRGGVLA